MLKKRRKWEHFVNFLVLVNFKLAKIGVKMCPKIMEMCKK